jgi:serine/threonine protein kinase
MDSVESICNSLARFKVLDAETIRTLRGLWREQGADRSDQPADFKRWLVQTGYVTDFQFDLLTRGFGDHLFLDDYKLLDRVAKGRHGGVFKAVHASGQKVAIKVLPPSSSKNPHVLGRFLRESRLATRLDHDNIVRTFHHGKTAQGTHFIVMEFLEGETLEEVIQRRKRLPAGEAVRLIIQALEGLLHLDEKSMIHRDIKPANMMIVSGGDSSRSRGRLAGITGASEQVPRVSGGSDPDTTLKSTLKIVDIGLSRALFDEGELTTDKVDLTREGTLLGTMNYMAPEQARDPHSADIRADIYGLGCVLYEMLAGQPPFPDKNLAKQIRRHAEETPRPLVEAAPGTPAALDAIVQKMLAKDPAMRHLTPGQAIKDLRNVLGSLGNPTVAAAPDRPLKTFLTWLETRPEDDDNVPQATGVSIPTTVAPPTPSPTRVAMAVKGTALVGQQPAASGPVAAKTVLSLPAEGPLPIVPVAVLVAPTPDVPATTANSAAAVPVQPKSSKASWFKASLRSFWTTTKDWSTKFARTVWALTLRDWALIGIGSLLTLLARWLWGLIN